MTTAGSEILASSHAQWQSHNQPTESRPYTSTRPQTQPTQVLRACSESMHAWQHQISIVLRLAKKLVQVGTDWHCSWMHDPSHVQSSRSAVIGNWNMYTHGVPVTAIRILMISYWLCRCGDLLHRSLQENKYLCDMSSWQKPKFKLLVTFLRAKLKCNSQQNEKHCLHVHSLRCLTKPTVASTLTGTWLGMSQNKSEWIQHILQRLSCPQIVSQQ